MAKFSKEIFKLLMENIGKPPAVNKPNVTTTTKDISSTSIAEEETELSKKRDNSSLCYLQEEK